MKNVRDYTPDVHTHPAVFVEYFIKNAKQSAGIRLQYRLTLNNLVEYEKRFSVRLWLTGIDMEFYHHFVGFPESRDYAPNTVGTRIKNLKLFLNQVFKKKIPVCLDFKLPEFKNLRKRFHRCTSRVRN